MEKKTSDGDEFDKHRAIHNVKMVHNLLAMVKNNRILKLKIIF